jgi:hypothetical protein
MKTAALVFAIPVLLLAGDFWKEKKPADWSEKEAKKMTERSPWAHETTPKMEGGMATGMPSGGGGGRSKGGGAPGGDMGGGGVRGGAGGVWGGAGMTPSIPAVHVRWESALPVREAFGRLDVQNPFPKELAEKAANYYVVTVEGLRVPMGRPRGDAKGGGQRGQQAEQEQLTPEAMKQMQSRMAQATTIVRTDKEPMKPEAVRILQGAKGPTFQFFFKKSDPITVEEKEVKLVVKMGPMTVETRFKPKDMVFEGALAL